MFHNANSNNDGSSVGLQEGEYMKRKISFLIHSMSRSGGTERVAANLCNYLSDESEQVINIVAIEPGIESFYPLPKNVSLMSLEISRPQNIIGWLTWYFRVAYKLRQVIKLQNYDFLIAFATIPSCCAVISGIALSIKILAFEHMHHLHYKNSFIFYIRRLLYPYMDAVIVLTERDQAYFSKFCRQSFAIPNIVTNLNYDDIQIDYSQKRILAVGRISKQKGFDLLLKTWVKIFKDFPEWKLNIAGGKSYLEMEYIKYFERLPEWENVGDSVNILSPETNILKYYQNASIYVMSSRWEGFPMVLLEAMSCGLAVTSFDCPNGPREIINDGINGFLVPAEDVNELSNSLRLLMTNIELRERLGIEAKKVREIYNWGNIGIKWKELFS